MATHSLKQKKIGVLAGGWSSEREVSLKSGQAAAAALASLAYDVVLIDAGHDLPEQLRQAGVDVALIALHGRGGEDGQVQGVLEVMRIPYSGSGVQACALAMDKICTKQLLQFHGLATPAFDYLLPDDEQEDLIRRCQGLPVVVKPSCEGSTVGVSIARTRQQLVDGVAVAAQLNGRLMLEEYIDGAEMTVSIINGRVLPVIQVLPEGGFYDYRAKYQSTTTRYLVPAPVDAELTEDIQHRALAAYRHLGCRGAARVDFIVRGREIFCIEINTVPGMTETSLLPKAAAAVGISFAQLVEMMVNDAGLDR